jgi:hypothetical protein
MDRNPAGDAIAEIAAVAAIAISRIAIAVAAIAVGRITIAVGRIAIAVIRPDAVGAGCSVNCAAICAVPCTF